MFVTLNPEFNTDLKVRDDLQVFVRFYEYFESYWIQQVTPYKFSVYALERRTNNTVECYHSQIGQKIKTKHPNYWVFLENLQQIAINADNDIERILNGEKLRRSTKSKYITRMIKVRAIETKLGENKISLSECFDMFAHLTSETELKTAEVTERWATEAEDQEENAMPISGNMEIDI